MTRADREPLLPVVGHAVHDEFEGCEECFKAGFEAGARWMSDRSVGVGVNFVHIDLPDDALDFDEQERPA